MVTILPYFLMTETEPKADLHRATETWPLVHAERAALAADLKALTDEQWATPSLCTRGSR